MAEGLSCKNIRMCNILFVIRNENNSTVNQRVTPCNTEGRNAWESAVGGLPPGHVGREILEEVVGKYAGNAAQERGVDALALEYVVDVLPVAVQLAGEPRNAALLPAQFFLYLVADMYHGG